MDELDRLGWVAGIAFTSHGVRLGIRVNDRALLDRLPACLPPGWKASQEERVDHLYSLRDAGRHPPSGGPDYQLYSNEELRLRTTDLGEVLHHIEHLVGFKAAVHAPRKLFVHAGVVGWRGRAIVIPGRSRSGKTSLVRALVRAGATYFSDEYAVFDLRGRIHPYPRPLSLRVEGSERPERCTPKELGGSSGTRALPVGLIVSTEYRAGAQWHPSALSPGQAWLVLLDNAVSARREPGLALTSLQQAVIRSLAIRSLRGEAEPVTIELLNQASRSWPNSGPVPERRTER